jgi:hypothetical protein
VSSAAKALMPRYHVTCGGVFYERLPYRNTHTHTHTHTHADPAAPAHTTRYIALAPMANTDNQKVRTHLLSA